MTFSCIIEYLIRYDRTHVIFSSNLLRREATAYGTLGNNTLKKLKQKRQLKVGSIKPCRCKLCQTCNFIQETTQIKNGNETVKILQNFNCNSRSLIYLIHCDSYGVQYVGESDRALRERYNGYRPRAHARLSKRTNVAVHFDACLCNFEQQCKSYPIEEIPNTVKGGKQEIKIRKGNLLDEEIKNLLIRWNEFRRQCKE